MVAVVWPPGTPVPSQEWEGLAQANQVSRTRTPVWMIAIFLRLRGARVPWAIFSLSLTLTQCEIGPGPTLPWR